MWTVYTLRIYALPHTLPQTFKQMLQCRRMRQSRAVPRKGESIYSYMFTSLNGVKQYDWIDISTQKCVYTFTSSLLNSKFRQFRCAVQKLSRPKRMYVWKVRFVAKNWVYSILDQFQWYSKVSNEGERKIEIRRLICILQFDNLF